jgi:hypothetical protein
MLLLLNEVIMSPTPANLSDKSHYVADTLVITADVSHQLTISDPKAIAVTWFATLA